ncbi:uncharacterized protein At4g14450, chloroplastic-like [Olea europaea var. sylvestris]|uniref:Uncharacterized protein n=1 Tax=Olea europaea subsp. europaea TaxID=158383 RepID=A0A8S0US54_OLEEU|nr:uncharacterized protein At4g14450, chloroplastic-like [Olea europaea var. sylvestris]CAA3021584.1 Hypothetical predicted protein [Olea europaea subsp. europaea]
MAENLKKNSDINRRQQKQLTRLQKKAPASIQINPVTDWNVAIPLLSPLVESPTSNCFPAEIKTGSNSNNKEPTAEKPEVMVKKWQHPAAPFCYEPAPVLPFVCTGSFGR